MLQNRVEERLRPEAFPDEPPERIGHSDNDRVDRARPDLGFKLYEIHGPPALRHFDQSTSISSTL